MTLDTPLTTLKRIGTIRSSALRRLDLETLGDLLFYFPFRYDDFRAQTKIKDLVVGQTVTVVGEIQLIQNKRSPRRRMYITEALVSDGTEMLRVVWFNQPFLTRNLRVGETASLAGRVSEDYSGLLLTSPVYEKITQSGGLHTQGLVPVYHLTADISQKQLRSAMKQVVSLTSMIEEWVPAEIIKKFDLWPLGKAVAEIHFPETPESLAKAKQRLGFNELYLLQLRAQRQRQALEQLEAPVIVFNEEQTKSFVRQLPFDLTPDQKKAAWEIVQAIGTTKPMVRLLQGDVGSGKTVVAALAAYNAALAGQQVVILAPTEILAFQHFTTFTTKFFADTDVSIALQTRSYHEFKAGNQEAETLSKKAMIEKIKTGEVQIIIGTHALLQDVVSFSSLGLVIIDEQHRFGVAQRGVLMEKSGEGRVPHLLSMTATPIPRSLALALYGDLDISLIKQLPAGRKRIETEVLGADQRDRAYERIVRELSAGRQAFVVCPLIDPSDKLGVKSVTAEFKRLDTGVFNDYNVGLLHGRLKPAEREQVMSEFVQGQIQLLIATSVIEIGVDIPNASVMMVEDADRFGLAQLHQYRGRVGRSDQQSYCFLITETTDPHSYERLKIMSQLDNGFDLARADLKFRGPGEVYGLAQKGFPELKMANFYDIELIKQAREAALETIEIDERLEKELGETENRAHLE